MLIRLLLLCLSQAEVETLDFGRDVRPLLSDRCYTCHGPDENAREGGFRLDLREEAVEDLGGYAAIVPGDPEASELVARVRHPKTRRRMPPVESKLELSEAEIALLERWIREGAPYAEHWAFETPLAHEPPTTERDDWVRDPLDRFVLAELEAHGFEPSPEVDRPTWLRRVSYDLTGLPPTLDQLDAFEADGHPDAFERQVDRLLASPRHAERMASVWLDAARYADTYGYQTDVERVVWPWRDWVLEAFENNLPYDEFLLWQIAGDLLPKATREQRLATAFNRLHRQTNEGGSTEEEFRVEYVADRVATLGEAVLGLTVGCARCHDHKFDPILQREYYALFAFFDDIDESGLYSHFTDAVPTPALELFDAEQESERRQLERRVAVETEALSEVRQQRLQSLVPVPHVQLRRDLVGHFRFESIDEGVLVNEVDPQHRGKAAVELQSVEGRVGRGLSFTGDDAATFEGLGEFRRSDPFSLGLWLWLPRHYERAVVLHRSRAWTDAGSRGYELLIEEGRASAALIHFWPGDALRLRTVSALPLESWVHVAMTWDGSGWARGLHLYLDGVEQDCEVVRDGLTRKIVGGGEGALTLGERFRDQGLAGGRMDELMVFVRELTGAEIGQLALAQEAVAPGAEALREHALRENDEEYRAALERLRVARRARDEARDLVPQIMTMVELPETRTAYRLERGSYDDRREPVGPDVPAVLGEFDEALPRNRLGLARWLTRPDHPLTARVEVNRLWALCFGTGLVATPEDFGSQGDPPSHPRLLDTLAHEFTRAGWDRRALLKRFVLSATYRQSSRASPRALERDPENRLLSHMPRKRLTAEMLRDGALFTAGLLVERRGGPPVKPYQPAGLWEEKSGQPYVADSGEGLWRRSLYTFWKRTSPPPSMMLFDAAKRDVCVVRRQVRSSPAQALVLWNDPQFVEASRMLAERMLREGGNTVAERVAYAFRSLTSRLPDGREGSVLHELYELQHSAFAAQPDAADALLSVGQAPSDPELDPIDVAPCAIVAQTVFSFDAALTTP